MLSSARNLSTGRICALIIASSGLLFAQSNPTGSISGTVKGPGGALIAGALLQYDSGRGTQEVRTNEKGQFLLSQLIPGLAKLKVHAKGMTDVSLQAMVLVNQSTQLNLVLKPEAEAVVEVVAQPAPQAGAEQTTALVGATFDNEALKSLPIIGDPLLAVTQMMPGVPASGTQFHASFDNANSYMYDGAEARSATQGSSTLQINRDLIEQIQILTGGVSARYGRFNGAMVSTVSKTGTNEFSGSMRHDLTSDSWNALPRLSFYDPISERVPRHVTDQQSWTFMGPIVKDKLFFAAGYTVETPGTLNVVHSSLRSGLFAPFSFESEGHRSTKDLKLDWQINTDHRFSASWQQYLGEISNGSSGTGRSSIATTSGPNRDERGFYSLGYLGVLSPTLQVDVKLSQTRLKTGGPGTGAQGGSNVITWVDRSVAGNGDTYDNGSARPLDDERIRTAGVNLTWFVADHTIEAGVQDYLSNYRSMGYQAPDLSYGAMTPSRQMIWFDGWTSATPPSMDRQYRNLDQYVSTTSRNRNRLILFDPLEGHVDMRVTGFYANDVWRIGPQWSLNYGARLDRYHYTSSPEGDSFTPTAFTPRASLSFDLKADGRHVFGVSYAEYAGLTNTGDFSSASVSTYVPIRLYEYHGTGTGADAVNPDGSVNWNVWGKSATQLGIANPYFTTASPTSNRSITVDSGIKPPRSREATLNYRYTDPVQNFIATLIYKMQDRYVDARYVGVFGAEDYAAPQVLFNDEGAKARYTGLELQYRRQVTSDLNLGGNVTWSGTYANVSQGGFNPRNDYGNGIPNDIVAPFGPQNGQFNNSTVPFTAHMDATYRKDFGKFGAVTVSVLGKYYSESFAGFRTVEGPIPDSIANYGYPSSFSRVYSNAKNWYPETYTFDFHLGYDYKIKGKTDFFAALDVTNVFNHIQPLQKSFNSRLVDGNGNYYDDGWAAAAVDPNWWSNPNFRPVGNPNAFFADGKVGLYTAPRKIQVKLGVRF